MDDRPRDLPPVQYKDTVGQPARRRRGWIPWLILALVLIVIGAVIWHAVKPGTSGGTRGRNAAAGAQPQPVGVAAVHTGDMPVTYAGLGTVTPISTVMVQSQISGQIMQIAFKEGQEVKPGDFLIQIDPRPYQVALEQAEGTLAHDKALLADAKLDLARYQTLLSQDSIASQTVDTQRALVHQYEGSITTDQGLIDSAKLNLVYCHITSPIGGRVGLQQVNLGNYITPAESNGLVVVTQLQPITVVFTLAEDYIPSIQKRLHGGASLTVTVRDRANKTVLGTGTLETLDNQIDTTTGTVKLKAIFDNPDETLFPNQFVNAELLLDTIHGALLVPQSGIQNGAPGSFVYLLQPNGTVSIQKVVLGVGDSNNIVVTSGLKAGDQVVVDGADRLKDGAKVTVPAKPAATAAGATPSGTTPSDTAAPAEPAASGQQQHHHHRRDTAAGGGNDASAPASGGDQPAAPPSPGAAPATTQQPAPQP